MAHATSRGGSLLLGILIGILPQAGAGAAEAERVRPRIMEAAAPNRVEFLCPGETTMVVEFSGTDQSRAARVVPAGGEAVTLPEQPSGSGFRYGDGTRELRGKGREVTWTDQSGRPVVCTEKADTAPPGAR
ncbi:hypothetical protein OPKNFCMD_0965 [Methylobacterium crusticola]|uniref:C-type lysozyme inhibitor domain-containing protein n=1 Tax=Methylobacterium crusticola TaxID=1697972 RepID=A0ABQ4QSE8_9HYPH|nr:MliC family protein [Methylobacterium crusticola]GJD48248.1 hypothetical protein OPKNFCMD_0965 [Methylobacterium crusticola]